MAVAALLHDPLPSGAQKRERHFIVICFLAVCFWFPPGVNGAELRTWTSKSGKFTVKAELLSLDQGVVSLRRENGIHRAIAVFVAPDGGGGAAFEALADNADDFAPLIRLVA